MSKISVPIPVFGLEIHFNSEEISFKDSITSGTTCGSSKTLQGLHHRRQIRLYFSLVTLIILRLKILHQGHLYGLTTNPKPSRRGDGSL